MSSPESSPQCVAEHDQYQTIHIAWHYPSHEVRETDPHYAAFDRVRARMKKAGLLRCAVCSSDKSVQLHHSHVEFSMQRGIDLTKLNELLGLHLDDEAFADWINSPSNLEPLCLEHHVGIEGIHLLPAPAWELLRLWKDNLPPPAQFIPAKELTS